ncbi:MAG: WhiB family transcriptional regulator [Propionibacteriaceae bacterium]
MSVIVLRPRAVDRLPCYDEDPEVFFGEKPEQVAIAKRACARCPLRVQCREEALERGEQYGVWGGQLIVEGVLLETKRGRGRPRKHAAA